MGSAKILVRIWKGRLEGGGGGGRSAEEDGGDATVMFLANSDVLSQWTGAGTLPESNLLRIFPRRNTTGLGCLLLYLQCS